MYDFPPLWQSIVYSFRDLLRYDILCLCHTAIKSTSVDLRKNECGSLLFMHDSRLFGLVSGPGLHCSILSSPLRNYSHTRSRKMGWIWCIAWVVVFVVVVFSSVLSIFVFMQIWKIYDGIRIKGIRIRKYCAVFP